ncbi:hypothetical protein, partial [Alienimonas chondri]|uniref:hypothetical protein n=1 Tax=Alienimonas chondri TaxID=2681879 RepID=UPI0014881548
MSETAAAWCGTAIAAALAALWAFALRSVYIADNRSTERRPGTRRRVVGAVFGFTWAPLPLLGWVVSDHPVPVLILAAVVVLTQQVAAALTFLGTLAAWRTVERFDPPAGPPPA